MLHHLGRPHSRLVRLPPSLFLPPLAIPCASPSAPRISCMSCAGCGCPCYSYPSMRAAPPTRPRFAKPAIFLGRQRRPCGPPHPHAPALRRGRRPAAAPCSPRPAMPPDCLPWAREQDLGRGRVAVPGPEPAPAPPWRPCPRQSACGIPLPPLCRSRSRSAVDRDRRHAARPLRRRRSPRRQRGGGRRGMLRIEWGLRASRGWQRPATPRLRPAARPPARPPAPAADAPIPQYAVFSGGRRKSQHAVL